MASNLVFALRGNSCENRKIVLEDPFAKTKRTLNEELDAETEPMRILLGFVCNLQDELGVARERLANQNGSL